MRRDLNPDSKCSWSLGWQRAALALFLVLSAILPSSTFAQLEGSAPFSSAGTTPEAVTEFLKRLQTAVAGDRRREVAALVEYPLTAWTGKKSVSIRNQSDFVAKYETIFTPALKATVAAAKVENGWANWQGVMWQQGRFWIRPVEPKDELKIVTINQPTEPAALR